MKTEVRIAEFKAKLSKYLRAVQRGREIVVKDRETPIVRVVPYTASRKRLITIPPTKSLKDVDELFKNLKPTNVTPEDLEEIWRWDRRDRFPEDESV